MNELTTEKRQLPDTLEDLSRFVLIGREKLNAVRAEIRAIKAVELAAEVHEQKLQEAQEIAEAVLDAETKLGELTAEMEKSVGGRPSETNNTAVNSKKAQLEEIGLSQMQASRFETLARHPETVEKAKADARKEGRIVTRQDVLNRIVVPQPRKNPIKEVIETAKKEHEDFRESKVVSLEDIEKDKLNAEIVNNQTQIKIMKAARAASDLGFLKSQDIKELVKALSKEEKGKLIQSLVLAQKTLMKIISDLEV